MNDSLPIVFFKSGDLFLEDAQALVNPVNCVGVMGAGLALAFKKKYPRNFQDYKRICDRGELRPGQILSYQENGVTIYNFPTKDHWKDPSKLEYITEGLASLIEHLNQDRPSVVNLPSLGCGLGGLQYSVVKPIMLEALLRGLNYPAKINVFEPK